MDSPGETLRRHLDDLLQRMRNVKDPAVFNRDEPRSHKVEHEIRQACERVRSVVAVRELRSQLSHISYAYKEYNELSGVLDQLCGTESLEHDQGEIINLIRNMRKDPREEHDNKTNWARVVRVIRALFEQLDSRWGPKCDWSPPPHVLKAQERTPPMDEEALQKAGFEFFVAKSAEARRIVNWAQQCLSLKGPMLIVGPSGTGKEMLARDLHKVHNRLHGLGGEYTPLLCSVLNTEPGYSQLVGAGKGIATGVNSRKGLLEKVGGGMLLLDEFHAVGFEQQHKLLRLLDQDNPDYQPVGEDSPPRPVEAKIVACTSEDLWAMVRQGKFHEPLLNRFGNRIVGIRPLHEREEDIAGLCRRYLEKRHSSIVCSEESLEKVVAFVASERWDGRMLQSELELRFEIEGATTLAAAFHGAPGLASVEELRDHIIALLERHKGNVRAAAAELYDDDHRTPAARGADLTRVLKRMGIDPKQYRSLKPQD